MTKEELGKLKLNELKELAKTEDVKISGLKKEDIIAMFMEKYAEDNPNVVFNIDTDDEPVPEGELKDTPGIILVE